jgi:extracellular elastinolytic metalloproteinase
VSTRLTGGPADSSCLGAVESTGMGEGWSDTMANAVRIKSNMNRDSDIVLGAWVSNNGNGIRDRPYSTSLERNPHTYKSVDGVTQQHQIGTVWASILYECMWNVIDKVGMSEDHGWDVQFDADGLPTDGRFMFMKLVIDGMAL